jgi:DNA uptake protein ComE-like DNA-binding protein
MLYLTKNEKGVLLSLAAIVLCGSIAQAAFKTYPHVAQSMNTEEKFINKTNVNTASFDELIRVPYIGEVSARAIIRYRKEKGKINALQEIQSIPYIYPSNYTKMVKYLKL